MREYPERCTAVVKLGGEMSCAEWCEDAGQVCQKTWDDAKGSKCTEKEEEDLGCDTKGLYKMVCKCGGPKRTTGGPHIAPIFEVIKAPKPGSDNVDLEKDLEKEVPKPTRPAPVKCCKALTTSCVACTERMSVEEYCAAFPKSPYRDGCKTMKIEKALMCELHEKSNRKLIVDECVNTPNGVPLWSSLEEK